MSDRINRAAVEQQLHELTGFAADSADIAKTMVVIDAWALTLSDSLSGDAQSHLHLLLQQAELLLDSAPSVSALRDRLSDLNETADAVIATLQQRLDKLTEMVEKDLALLTAPPAVELTEDMRAAVLEVLPDLPSRDDLMDQFCDPDLTLTVGKVKDEWDEPAASADELADRARGVRNTEETVEVWCAHCRQWKPAARFYRNKKSRTGYESKCTDCRKAA